MKRRGMHYIRLEMPAATASLHDLLLRYETSLQNMKQQQILGVRAPAAQRPCASGVLGFSTVLAAAGS